MSLLVSKPWLVSSSLDPFQVIMLKEKKLEMYKQINKRRYNKGRLKILCMDLIFSLPI